MIWPTEILGVLGLERMEDEEVLAPLEKSGVVENTLVIFTSDNCPWMVYGNHGGPYISSSEYG